MTYIIVKGAEPNRVGFWEKDARHPDGEVFVTYDAPVEVYPTQGVQRRLQLGLLVQVGEAESEEDAPDTDDNNMVAVFGEKVGSLLISAGYASPLEVDADTDETLLAVDGIGPATLEQIREALS